MSNVSNNSTYDLLIIGGGINGCGIARDAAGRGLKVLLVEQDDLASATSSWSSKLIHGGLRYLEQYEFRLVREALQEREVLLRIAPHLIHPLEFILPHDKHMRPAWMIQLGLFLYDHLGGKISLPRSRMVMFPDKQYSAGLKPVIRRGFFYSDARVDDARLTVMNALSAHEQGADIRTRTRCIAAKRGTDVWDITLQDAITGEQSQVTAHGVVNAAGPWVKQVLDETIHMESDHSIKLVKGSHIVVPRVHDQPHACILQNADKRVVFIIPYENDFSLIGTTDMAIEQVSDAHGISDDETDYLIQVANIYLAKPISRQDIVWSYSGVRPLYDDGSNNPSAITRDYVLKVDHQHGKLPLLSIFGGKITTYRRLAEHALEELQSFYPKMGKRWTHSVSLPGSEFEDAIEALADLYSRFFMLPPDYIAKLFTRHGDRTEKLLNGVKSFADLGEQFGNGANLLCAREIDFLMRHEWAKSADDILWRRTKCGLHMSDEQRQAAAAYIAKTAKL